MVEGLERRCLYSAAVLHNRPVFSVTDGTLSVSGSVHDDTITLVVRSDDTMVLTLNGKRRRIGRTVTRAVIYGGRGNDQVTNETKIATHIDGGTGDDALQSGTGDDTLFGGTGDDTLTGIQSFYDPHVYMDGGPGDDRLRFGSTMYGGQGYDSAGIDSTYYADQPGTPYNIRIISGGIEEHEEVGSGDISTTGPLRPYPNLASRGGKLLLTYQRNGYAVLSVSSPRVRADGKVEVAVDLDNAFPQTPPVATLYPVLFDARYTALANRRGLVLSIDGTDYEALVPGR